MRELTCKNCELFDRIKELELENVVLKDAKRKLEQENEELKEDLLSWRVIGMSRTEFLRKLVEKGFK